MDDPKTSTSEKQPDSDGLSRAVRGRILRLHPLDVGGGMGSHLARQWDRAGAFATEILGRFRTPGAVEPSRMPLARTTGATQESEPLALRKSSVISSSRQSQAQPGIISSVAPQSEGALAGSSISKTVAPQGSFVQRKATFEDNPTANDAVRKTTENQNNLSMLEGHSRNEKANMPGSYTVKHGKTHEHVVAPQATATVRMNTRLQDTIGPQLVQRHVGFPGSVMADTSRLSSLNGPSAKTPSLSGANDLPVLSGQRDTSGFAQASSASAPVLRKATEQSANPPVEKIDRLESSDGAKPAASNSDSVHLAHVVGPLADSFPSRSPLVKPVRPSGSVTIQRYVTGQPPLASELLNRIQPALAGESGSMLTVAPPVARFPDLATGTAKADTARAATSLSGLPSPILPSGPVNVFSRRSIEARGGTQVPVPVSVSSLATVSGEKGSVMRKPAAAIATAGATQGEAMPVSRLMSSADGLHGFGGRLYGSGDSLSAPVSVTNKDNQGALPLVQVQGGARQSSSALARESVARSAYSSSTGMLVQRSDVESSASEASSGAVTAPSATGQPDTRAAELSPGAAVDMERLADEIYQIIERRLIAEKESRGL